MAEREEVDQSGYRDWTDRIAEYERGFQKWERRVDKIQERYRSDDQQDRRSKTARFNVLWSNVQILLPATFGRLPKADVSRRHRDNDPVGRVASLILERALEYEISAEPDFRAAMTQSVLDRFLGGRGTAWVRYEPKFGTPGLPEDGYQLTEDREDESEAAEVLEWEHSPVDYVHWRDFGHTVARTWEEVTAVWRRVYLGREALVERFGEEIGGRIPLDTTPDELRKAGTNLGDPAHSQAAIYEIWDKTGGEAIWLSKSMGEIIDRQPDPLKLADFWPCPRPLFATLTTDSLVPVPDYAQYQDQAMLLDTLAERIDGLVNALKVTGAYDASTPELGRIFTEGENTTLVPVKNWAAFVERQGLKGSLDLVDLTPIANALAECYKAAEEIKGAIYEITGISDILRGATDPDETASAQRLKASTGSLRLKNNQEDVARFASDLLRIKAQIICGNYSPETLLRMSAAAQLKPQDQQLIPQAMALLKGGVTRDFRIDVEADSMVKLDEEAEKSNRMEFLQATGQFLERATSAVAQTPELAPLALEMLRFGVTGFRVGKTIEGVFDQAADQIQQAVAQRQANPQPDPAMVKANADIQVKQAELQYKAQADEIAARREMALEQFRAEQEMRVEQFRQHMQAQQVAHQNAMEAQRDQLQARNEAALEQLRISNDAQLGKLHEMVAVLVARIGAASRVEVAEITAQTALDTAQISAANSAAEAEA